MKTKKFEKKLSINKSTVTHLQGSDLKNIKGGAVTQIMGCTNIYCNTIISCIKYCPV